MASTTVGGGVCTMADDGGDAAEATMTATWLAELCAMIDDHAAAGTMSGRKVASISAMIGDRNAAAAAAAEEEGSRSRWRGWWRRRRLDDTSTRSYRQICRLDEGGFGHVVKARHRGTGQTVAMKALNAADAGELLREACFLAACRGHPSVVGLHSVARNPSSKGYCLVMEYVGPSLIHALHEQVKRHGRPFPQAYVRRVMHQLLGGIQAMHERRIIHRDIKASNILVAEDDGGGGGAVKVKICDFGLAMCTAMAAPPYDHVGTDWYMAPEMLLEKPEYDEVVDMWSLGCVMALLLSGKVLFRERETKAQLHRIFDVLGAPSRETCRVFKSKLLADEVWRWREKPRQEQRGGDRLRELFPEKMLSQDGFDVLKGLLTFNPDERLTAAAALGHPWFAGGAMDDDSKFGTTTSLLRMMRVYLSLAGLVISSWALVRWMVTPYS